MSFWQKLKYLLPFFRRAQERDIREELQSLAAIAEVGELGNLTRAAEEARSVWIWTWLEQLHRDVQYAFRAMRHNIGFTTTAVLSLALGIGANTAIFSLIDAVMLRWLPVENPQELVRLTLGGVGGAFGAREDVSLHIHSCLLALHTGRPVKMVYSRKESFLGHVHRHPARIWMRHSAEADGTLVSFETRIVLDGGAYRSSSFHVTANAACFSAGPYRVPNAKVEAFGVRTNNPPCGAMRGFGAVQVAFAHEAQMDLLAEACAVDPVELRLRNALAPGDELLTGQRITGTLPVAEVIRACAEMPLPAPAVDDVLARPGGAGRTSDAIDVQRGVGFAVGFKNLMYAEGYDDYSTARCSLTDGVATITCAAAEVGQGFVTLVQQFARTIQEVRQIVVAHGRNPLLAGIEARARLLKISAAQPIKRKFYPLYSFVRRTINRSYSPAE